MTLPAWTDAEWTGRVGEPFRSDSEFWSSLAASADAMITLVAAIVLGIVLMITGAGGWALLPFVVPTLLTGRAALVGRASSKRSQAAFADRRAWRDAERAAVATAFFRVLRRQRLRRPSGGWSNAQ